MFIILYLYMLAMYINLAATFIRSYHLHVHQSERFISHTKIIGNN